MSIASEISRLQTAKADLKTAIEGKGVSVPASAKLDAYPALVDSIEQGGGGGGTTAKPNDVEFIDYDGTIVASYSAAEFANLAALPDNPDHTADGLVSQGWNWTLSNAKTYVANYGKLVIGQMYNTNDGATRITFDMSDWAKPWPITMQFTQSKANGVAVDWGDGSAVERVSGTSNVKLNHTYATTGVYVISLLPDSGCTLTITGSSSSGSYLFAQANGDRFKLSSVKSVHIGNNVAIGDYALKYCYSLQSVTIPSSVTSIGSNAFHSCYSLLSVTIPSGVTSTSDNTFYNCYSLQSVTIPSSVTRTGNSMFYNCYSLRSVTIPSGVTSIGAGMFSYCYSLRPVTIPSGVPSIGNSTFYNCYSLQSVTIPSSVTSIGSNAFGYCYSLKEMIFERTSPPTLGGTSNSLGSTSSTFPIYVPDSAVSSYKSSYSNYASRIKGISERGGVVINTGMSTGELVEVADGSYDITIYLDGSITCATINSAFANGDAVTFKFTEGDLVLEQSDVETASANYAALSTSGNRKIESLFGLSGVSNVEIYLDDTAQTVDIAITI